MSIDNILLLFVMAWLGFQFRSLSKLFREAFPKKLISSGTTTELEKNPLRLEGFGLVFKGNIVLDKKCPLFFDSYKEAKEYAKTRGFGKGTSLLPISKEHEVHVVWQKWDPEARTVFIGEITNVNQ